MSDTETLEPRTTDPKRLRFQWWWLPAALVIAVVVATLPRLLADPATVGRVSVANRTDYTMSVEVTGAQRDGWMGLGTAERESTTELRDVIDQGGTWIFRFTSQGLDAGELRFGKDDLKRSGWKIVIPTSVGERLTRQGATPTPPSDF